MAEMTLCIEEVHRLGWIHRDIKPDNFLISASGHLKISDFGLSFDGHWSHSQSYHHEQRESFLEHYGWCNDRNSSDRDQCNKRGQQCCHIRELPSSSMEPTMPLSEWCKSSHRRDIARSVVGTAQYMAPEVVMGLPYDSLSDWWSLGIIIYECLYGATPFWRGDRESTKQCIVDHRRTLGFPDGDLWSRPRTVFERRLPPVSDTAKDLLRRILTHSADRLVLNSAQTNGWTESRALGNANGLNCYEPLDEAATCNLKSHPWFARIPWTHLHMMRPPFVPNIKPNQSITKYFEDELNILEDSSESIPVNVPAAASLDCAEGGAAVLSDHGEAKTGARPWIRSDGYQLNKTLVDPDNANPAGQLYMLPNYDINRIPPQMDGRDEPEDRITARSEAAPQKPPEKAPIRKSRRTRRARDKLLRDPRYGKQVMELRKGYAFLGYSWRRPGGERGLLPWFDDLDGLTE